AISVGVASPRMITPNASRVCCCVSPSRAATVLMAATSASGATRQRSCQSLRESGLCRGERAHEAEQTHALDVFLDEEPAMRAVGHVHNTDQFVVQHERK